MSGSVDLKFYVYVIFRLNGEPCYVGKGCARRMEQHFSPKGTHNPILSRIIAKSGGRLPAVRVRENLSHDEAEETEIAFIAAIGRIKNGGPLVNLTDGGKGGAGHVLSPEAKEKIGAAHRGKPKTEDHKAVMSAQRKGRRVTPVTKGKIASTLKGKPKTKEHGDAVSRAKKGKALGPMSADQRAAIGNAHRGRKRSEAEMEACRRGRDAMTFEQRAQKSARISAALTGKRLTEEHRRKIGDVQRGKPKPRAPSTPGSVPLKRPGRKPMTPEALARRRIRKAMKAAQVMSQPGK